MIVISQNYSISIESNVNSSSINVSERQNVSYEANMDRNYANIYSTSVEGRKDLCMKFTKRKPSSSHLGKGA